LAAGTKRLVAGAVGAAAVCVFASWFDTTVMVGADEASTRTFDASGFGVAYGAGSLVVAGLVLAVSAIGWRCRSVRLGLVYALVGALLAFIVLISIELPRSSLGLEMTSALSTVQLWTNGPLHATSIIGGAMLIVGVAQIVDGLVHRRARAIAHEPAAEPAVEADVPRATIEDVAGIVPS